jgi:hypothetical protein
VTRPHRTGFDRNGLASQQIGATRDALYARPQERSRD